LFDFIRFLCVVDGSLKETDKPVQRVLVHGINVGQVT
jgi:hypothetical protein